MRIAFSAFAPSSISAELQASDQVQDQLKSALRRVSAPVIPVLDQVVVMPMTGELDAERMGQLMEDVLAGLERYDARLAILDITGVPGVDEAVAEVSLRTVDAVGLLGAECVLVGIRPQVAHTMMDLGIDLREITSRRDLQSGIEYALERIGRHIVAR